MARCFRAFEFGAEESRWGVTGELQVPQPSHFSTGDTWHAEAEDF